MIASEISFYVAGGTLRQDAPSYVERQADADLFDGLMAGDFCYALTSRQMGKSSLMVRTAARLKAAGVTVVSLDLTGIGQNLSVDQWYLGLLNQLGQPLDLEDELEGFWFERDAYGPLQRWVAAVREVVLPRVSGRLVIFVDEIDVVRGLPFSTDEFFAGVRELYVRRATDPELERLAFCFLGVAAPSHLIRDTRLTPFNVGRRIELTDFTEAQAGPLAEGLGRPNAEALVKRVLHWTGGHPYLTQRLCATVAEDPSVTDGVGVDRKCDELFLSHAAREQDTNLLFVRESLLRSEVDRAAVLDLYGRILRGRRPADDAVNPLVTHLKLSGVTRTDRGALRVRNRIYERVFDRHWILENMPDADLRRQRAAYRRGLARAGVLGGAVMAALALLAAAALFQAHRAGEQHRLADRQRQAAEEEKRATRRILYAADMGLAQDAWERGATQQALDLLAAYAPRRGEEDLRSFDWRYLMTLCRRDFSRSVLRPQIGPVNSVAYSPDGRTLAVAGSSNAVALFDTKSRRPAASLAAGPAGTIFYAAFSPDGRLLAMGGSDRVVRLWDLITSRQVGSMKTAGDLNVMIFSPDGRLVVAGGGDNTLEVWSVAARRKVATLKAHTQFITAAVFSPDGLRVATGGWDRTVKLWDAVSWREVASLDVYANVTSLAFSPDGRTVVAGIYNGTVERWDMGSMGVLDLTQSHTFPIEKVAVSSDGKILATGSDDNDVKLWDVRSMRAEATLRGHRGGIASVAFSPDGKTLATGSSDQTVRLWNVGPSEPEDLLLGHRNWVKAVAFSPDGKTLATGSYDRTIRLWDVAAGRLKWTLTGHRWRIDGLAFSPDGRTIASVSGEDFENKPNGHGELKLWDVARGREAAGFPGWTKSVTSVAFSPDGKTLATGNNDRTARLWDVATRRQIGILKGHTGDVYSVAFSPDGKTLATGSVDTTVKLWDLAARKERATLRKFADQVNSVTFSPDGALLATGSMDALVKIWDARTYRELVTLGEATEGLACLAFAPDGRTLAATYRPGTVDLWNVASRRRTLTLRGHTGMVDAAAFSPDGTIIATGSADQTVRLYRADSFGQLGLPALAYAPRWPGRLAATRTAPQGTGLLAHFYKGPGDGSTPARFGRPLLTRVDRVIDFDWGGAVPAKGIPANFQVQWTGLLRAPQSGLYRFELESDDGSRLFLDGQRLISAWWGQSAATAAVEVSLAAGWHRLRVDYFQAVGPDMVHLRWSYPFGSRPRVVPADCLRH